MCQERDHLASLEYWRSPPERVAQRFYTAVCLLVSSIQDWLLGLKEKQTNNLNWSATCSYYSLVHGGRIREGIRAKLMHTESLEMRLEEVLKRIGTESKDVPHGKLEREVSMSFFENKRGLMRDFENKIQRLATVTKE